jgi:hypothetical protein
VVLAHTEIAGIVDFEAGEYRSHRMPLALVVLKESGLPSLDRMDSSVRSFVAVDVDHYWCAGEQDIGLG